MKATLRAWLTDMLKGDEGLRLRVYDDATGKPLKPGDQLKGQPTIGYGRNLAQVGLTIDEAAALLATDVGVLEQTLPRRLDWLETLDEPRQAVLYNMAYNLGVSGLLNFRRMLTACKHRDFESAAGEMEASAWYRTVGARGRRLVKVMRTGAFL
jgi:lysozyme